MALWKGLSQLQLDGASSEQLGWRFPHKLLSSLRQLKLWGVSVFLLQASGVAALAFSDLHREHRLCSFNYSLNVQNWLVFGFKSITKQKAISAERCEIQVLEMKNSQSH